MQNPSSTLKENKKINRRKTKAKRNKLTRKVQRLDWKSRTKYVPYDFLGINFILLCNKYFRVFVTLHDFTKRKIQ